MSAVKAHTADLATELVDEAGRLLATEGPAALTLRRLATATHTSTMAVYTLFGDKPGLLRAMHRAGFERLGAALRLAAESSQDPLGALAAQGTAYRATALANPHLYGLMFGNAVPGFAPDEAGQQVADAAYSPLVAGVRRCLDSGALRGPSGDRDADAARIALHLWAVAHGMVSLELTGQLPAGDPEQAYVEAMIYSSVPFLVAG